MSEMPPEEGGAPGGGSFLSKKFLGIPAIVWMAGAALLAYMYFRSQSGSGSGSSTATGATSNNGTSTTGNTTFGAPTTNLSITSQYTQSSSTTSQHNTTTPAPRHATPNPQPTPKPKTPVKKHTTTVKTPAKYVTVAKWTASNTPWNSTLWGIANHEHTSVAALLKLNPQIKNANVIQPGEKIKI